MTISNDQPNPVTQAVLGCLQAYHSVLEQGPGGDKEYETEEKARKAFLRAMPFLDTWEHTLAGLACLQHAMLLGVIDNVDAGRHIHLIQLAISAYRPKAEPRAQGRPRKNTPLPTIGNMESDLLGTYVSPELPDQDTQRELCQELTRRGIPLPTPAETSASPRLLPLLLALGRVYERVPRRPQAQSDPKIGVASHPTVETKLQAAG